VLTPESEYSRRLEDPKEKLIRSYYWNRKIIVDQKTKRLRPPSSAFRLRPNEASLSVNIESSLLGDNKPADWGIDKNIFYAIRLTVGGCTARGLSVIRDPVEHNKHHGSILGVVELRNEDPDAYEALVTDLAQESEILPEYIQMYEKSKKK
jgi:hypothetical protein